MTLVVSDRTRPGFRLDAPEGGRSAGPRRALRGTPLKKSTIKNTIKIISIKTATFASQVEKMDDEERVRCMKVRQPTE
jgi:hypothetical protein